MNPARRLVPVTALAVLLAAWIEIAGQLGPQDNASYCVTPRCLGWTHIDENDKEWGWHFAVLIPSTAAMVLLVCIHRLEGPFSSGRKTRHGSPSWQPSH